MTLFNLKRLIGRLYLIFCVTVSVVGLVIIIYTINGWRL